jgi:hypothetical protein
MVRREGLAVEDVQSCSGEAAGTQRVDERLLFNDRTPGNVLPRSLPSSSSPGRQRAAYYGSAQRDEEDPEHVRRGQEFVLGDFGDADLGRPAADAQSKANRR